MVLFTFLCCVSWKGQASKIFFRREIAFWWSLSYCLLQGWSLALWLRFPILLYKVCLFVWLLTCPGSGSSLFGSYFVLLSFRLSVTFAATESRPIALKFRMLLSFFWEKPHLIEHVPLTLSLPRAALFHQLRGRGFSLKEMWDRSGIMTHDRMSRPS